MATSIPEAPPSTASQPVLDDRFRRIFTSEPLTFLVGKDEKPIYANAAAIAEQSEPLSRLINGGIAEAKKTVSLPHVLEDDFVRVCQFAYTGDYTIVPAGAMDEQNSVPSYSTAEEPIPVDQMPVDQTPTSRLPKKSKKGKRKSVPEVPQEKDTEMVNGLNGVNGVNGDSAHDILREKVEAWHISTQDPPSQNLALLEHARLYVFGEQWAIEPLKSLSITKLAEHARTATVDSYFVEKFVELTRYSYSNTLDSGKDALREFVIELLNTHLEAIGKSGSFPLLLEDGGPFVRELWSVLQKKLF